MKFIVPHLFTEVILEIKKANGFEHKPLENIDELNLGSIDYWEDRYDTNYECYLNTKELNKLSIENLPSLTEFLKVYGGQEKYDRCYNPGCKGWGYVKYFKRRIYNWKKKQEKR